MSGIKKFDSLQDACEALGVTEVTDANRSVLEGLVRKAPSGAVSASKNKMFDLADEIGMTDGMTITVVNEDGEEEDVRYEKPKETATSMKVLIAFYMKNTEHEDLDKFLEDNNWVFSDYDNKLYRLKRKATPITARELPKEGTVGYAVMSMVGDEQYKTLEFSDIAAVLAKNGMETTTKTVAFYDNFAQHRADDCAEQFGDGWEHIRRPSVVMKDYGSVMTVAEARVKKQGRKAAPAAA